MFYELRAYLCVCAKSLQLYSTLCDPMDCRVLPGSSVHGILQARTLEWVSIPSSRGSSRPRDRTCVSVSSALVGRFFTTSTIWEAPESLYSLSPSTWLEYCLLRGKVFICDGSGWSRHFCVQFLIRGVCPASGKHWAFSPASKPFTVEGSWWHYWKERFYLLFCGPSSQWSATRKVCN